MRELKQKLLQGIGELNDRSEKIFADLETKIYATYINNTELIRKEANVTIEAYKEIQRNSNKRFKSYYGRKKFIDYLIFINLSIVPITLALVVILGYILFFKK